MDISLLLTLLIIVFGVILFIRETFTVDTTSIIIMTLLIVTGVLTPEEGFQGFNHPATITLGCMFVISSALFKSGVMNKLNLYLLKLGKRSYLLAVTALMLSGMIASAFINDTAVVAMLLPVALYLADHMKIGPSKLLIPLSFASLFGGTCTLIGTSTNLLVSGYVQESGLQPFTVFEFSMPALIIAAIGFLYMVFIGIHILPNRKSEKQLSARTEEYLIELTIQPDSIDNGKYIQDSEVVKNYDINVLQIERDDKFIVNIGPEHTLMAGDILKAIITPSNLARINHDSNYLLNHSSDLEINNSSGPLNFYEVLIPFGSDLAGSTPKELDFRRKYRATILGLKHRRDLIVNSISDTRLREGDLLLIMTSKFRLQELITQKLLYSLSELRSGTANKRNVYLSFIILVAVVLSAAIGLTNILISGMLGALLIIALNILSPKEAYNAIDWKVIFMVAGVLSMGTALEKTGGAELIGTFTADIMGTFHPSYTLAIIYLITFLSTNIMSSKATAALMAPIVINVAQSMGLSERPFLVAVMFACSLTFMTPVSYPTSTMIYTPGNYKFSDFLKIGTPLNIITWIIASIIIPYFFPF